MAALSQMKQVNVHVYERRGNGYKRISAFDYHISPEKRPTIRVIYQGGVHYGEYYSSTFLSNVSYSLEDAIVL